jgi:hypothetical protein
MGAREKLNKGYFVSSLLLAAVIGGLTQSFVVFVVALVILLVLSVHSGDIRPPRRDRCR